MLAPIDLLSGFAINLAVAGVVVRFIYYPVKQSKNYVFTFLAFSTAVFFLMSVLNSVELSIGVGLGLFGIFSLLRYRTDPMPAREMTYLFTIIALAILNAVLMSSGAWPALLAADAAITAVLYLLESEWGFHYESSQRVTYERIELIKPERYPELLDDLRERTGLPVRRVEMGPISFLRDTVDLKVYYDEPRNEAGALAWFGARTEVVHSNGRHYEDDDD